MKTKGVVVETHPDGLIIRAEVKANPFKPGIVGYYLVPESSVTKTGGQASVQCGDTEVLGDNAEFDLRYSTTNSPTLEDLLEEAFEDDV